MQIGQQALQKLRRIWEKKNPNKPPLSDDEVLNLGIRLTSLVEAIYKPLLELEAEEIKEKSRSSSLGKGKK